MVESEVQEVRWEVEKKEEERWKSWPFCAKAFALIHFTPFLSQHPFGTLFDNIPYISHQNLVSS